MKRLTQTLAFCLLTAFTAVAQKNYVSCLLYTSDAADE